MKQLIKRGLTLIFLLVLSILIVQSARQPTVDGDNNNWGTILNEYLNVSHTENGTLKKGLNVSFYDVNITNNLNVSGNISADYLIGNTSLLTKSDGTYWLGELLYDVIDYLFLRDTQINTTGNIQSLGFPLASSLPNITNSFLDANYPNRTEVKAMNGTWNADLLDNQDGSYYLDNTDYCVGGVCSGNLIINGNLTIIGDEIIANVTTQNLNGSFLPSINNQFDIGSESLLWKNIYSTTLYGSLGWANLTDYPSACTSSQTLTTIADTLTCSAISITESQISDLTHINTNDLGIFNTTMASNSNDSVKSELRNNIDTNYTALNNRDNAINTSSNIYSLAPHTNRTDTEVNDLIDTRVDATFVDDLFVDDLTTDADTTYNSDEIYIYESTDTFYLNETKLNDTIDLRDTDTTYTADEGNITLVGTVFHLLKADLAELDNSISAFITSSALSPYQLIAGAYTITNFTAHYATMGAYTDANFTSAESYVLTPHTNRSDMDITSVVNVSSSFWDIIVSDLLCTNCIGGTEIAELTDVDISNTLTASDLQAGSSVVADSEVDNDLTINTDKQMIIQDNIKLCLGTGCNVYLIYNTTTLVGELG